MLYDSISPVNVFRVVLNHTFDARLPLLPDRHYRSRPGRPYDFVDVTDRVVEERAGVTRIERIRAWDGCTSTNYRRIAGGHNPRPTKPERLRNRFYCKFCKRTL